jgi:hypothetical protein
LLHTKLNSFAHVISPWHFHLISRVCDITPPLHPLKKKKKKETTEEETTQNKPTFFRRITITKYFRYSIFSEKSFFLYWKKKNFHICYVISRPWFMTLVTKRKKSGMSSGQRKGGRKDGWTIACGKRSIFDLEKKKKKKTKFHRKWKESNRQVGGHAQNSAFDTCAYHHFQILFSPFNLKGRWLQTRNTKFSEKEKVEKILVVHRKKRFKKKKKTNGKFLLYLVNLNVFLFHSFKSLLLLNSIGRCLSSKQTQSEKRKRKKEKLVHIPKLNRRRTPVWVNYL